MQRSRCACLSLVALAVLANPVFATVRHVPGDYATIQSAIDAAVVGDVVEVACGTYQVPETIMKSGITLRSTTGDEDCVVVEPVGPPEDERRLIKVIATLPTTIRGITFRSGASSGCAPVFLQGVEVFNCKFLSNRGRFVIQANTVESTRSSDPCNSGAAIVLGAYAVNCSFIDNSASGSPIDVLPSSLFSDCTFTGNVAADGSGGAISCQSVVFYGCTFDGNHAYFSGGAAVASNSEFNHCYFTNNSAGLKGGAIYGCSLLILFDVFHRNVAGWLPSPEGPKGGAIYLGGYGCSGSEIVLCTFNENDVSPPLLRLVPTGTLPSGQGAAVFIEDTAPAIINQSIIAFNLGGDAIHCDAPPNTGVTSSNICGNVLGDWTGCIANQQGAYGNISVDPMFCDAPNGDLHLSSLSPCLYQEYPMGPFGQGCFDEKPALFEVGDVGNDQGRQVRLIWQRSQNDSPSASPFVIGYGVYRKHDQFAKDAPLPEMARGEGVAIPGWDYLGTVPSRGDSLYETVVPTLCDSTITNGQCLSTFFVSAMTQNPFVYWDSPLHSGYSKDNLAPPTPTGFGIAYNTGNGNRLEWDAVAAGDFAGFHVYRSLPPGQTASADELVATTTQTTWTDPNFDGWNAHYEVTSFDGAGNESAPAIAGTTTPVPIVTPSQLELLPNIPNPFNPSTSIRFTTPDEGVVRIAIYDARGSLVRVLVDKTLPAGHHDAIWDGRDGKGAPVSSGVYLCRLEQRSDFRTRKIVLIK